MRGGGGGDRPPPSPEELEAVMLQAPVRECRGVPYRQLVDIYRARLERTKNPDKRLELELTISSLLAIIEMQDKLDKSFEVLTQLADRISER